MTTHVFRRIDGLSPTSTARVRRSTLTGLTGSIRAARVRRREVNTLTSFFSYLNTLRKGEEGQTMAEYGVVLAVITIGIVVALTALSGGMCIRSFCSDLVRAALHDRAFQLRPQLPQPRARRPVQSNSGWPGSLSVA